MSGAVRNAQREHIVAYLTSSWPVFAATDAAFFGAEREERFALNRLTFFGWAPVALVDYFQSRSNHFCFLRAGGAAREKSVRDKKPATFSHSNFYILDSNQKCADW